MTMPEYQIGDYRFEARSFLPIDLFDAITDQRVRNPTVAFEEAHRLRKRKQLTLDGKLVILATDHPGRRVTGLRDDPLAMGNRLEYLSRALRVITTPGCDGVMGTTDFMEDLLILSHLFREARGDSFLDEKVLVGCMNRGGHAGVRGEIDDRFTSFTAEQLKRLNFDGGKLMYRLDLADERSIKSIEDCALAVTELFRQDLYSFLEPMSVKRKPDGGYETVKTVEALVKDAGAAAALGESSMKTWLKLSYVEGYERVARATRLPILMLGGPALETPMPTLSDFHAGISASANVRGAMVGRNVSFPNKEDPRGVAAAVCAIVHEEATMEQALERLQGERGQGMDAFNL